MLANIGESYGLSTGRSYVAPRHTAEVSKKPERTVWERVKEALQDAGYAGVQPEAAKLIGIKQGSVSDWNKPGMGPSLGNAITIAIKLNVCVEWVLTERGPKRPGPPMEASARKLWDAWGRIPGDDQKEIVGFALAKVRPISKTSDRP